MYLELLSCPSRPILAPLIVANPYCTTILSLAVPPETEA